ncbi:TPA: hypothetical protein N0F65_010774 [Lagenidium giganteum]|uniref:Uncharacterized protein n=1 Tax=Lagenidium giganteum TaxID=4803 RepID=A0AAV2YQY7_9STRA|nr:TPA: hypothetical protein N0F65_010774 [Lagenidium giganteum]
MNLKMEIAHLRERLQMRVGGDTNAMELEAENFTLKKSLGETQEELAKHQNALRDMDAKYSKAMLNLMKLDQAWKSSKEETLAAEEQVRSKADEIERLQQELQTAREDHAAEVDKMEEKMASLSQEKDTLSVQVEEMTVEKQKRTLQMKELEGHLQELKKKSEGLKLTTKQEYDELENKLMDSVEENATLRGVGNALREDLAAAQQQLTELRTAYTACTSRLLQLKEEHASTQVHLESMKQSVAGYQEEISVLKSAIERIQTELKKRDDRLLDMEKQKLKLEGEVEQQRKLAEFAEHEHDHSSKRTELMKEKEWKAREFELEKKVEKAQQETKRVQEDLWKAQHVHEEVLRVLGGETAGLSDAVELAKAAVEQAQSNGSTSETLKFKLSKAEKELERMKQLETENNNLRAQYDKVKKSMERMVQRRTKFVVTKTQADDKENSGADRGVEITTKSTPMATATIAKRKRVEDDSGTTRTNATTPVRPKQVFVSSRYMNY